VFLELPEEEELRGSNIDAARASWGLATVQEEAVSPESISGSNWMKRCSEVPPITTAQSAGQVAQATDLADLFRTELVVARRDWALPGHGWVRDTAPTGGGRVRTENVA
jgi:hypothetical protein